MHILVYGFSGKILGGIETFILNMNEHMSSDCIFDYIIDGNECVYRERIEKRGGSVFYVPAVKITPFKYIKTFHRILKEQRNSGTNVLYIQLFSMANVLPALIAKKAGYKVILHSHNNGLQNKNILYKWIHLVGKRLTRNGDYIRLTNSRLSGDFMFGKGLKSEVIYNAIDLQKFAFKQDIRDRIRMENDGEGKVVIGFVGRFMMQKNPIFMLQVFAELTKIVENCELWIVGEGEMKDAMDAEVVRLGIGNSVKWLGRRSDVNELMMGMDLLLQPSIFEGLGIVLVEAQATGLPVVASAEVIPEEAAATPLIKFVRLSESSFKWADECIRQIRQTRINNYRQGKLVFPEEFDINQEAKRLERVIANTSSDD